MAGPAVPGRWLEPGSNSWPQIDGRSRQNPAYRPTHTKDPGSHDPGSFVIVLCFLFSSPQEDQQTEHADDEYCDNGPLHAENRVVAEAAPGALQMEPG